MIRAAATPTASPTIRAAAASSVEGIRDGWAGDDCFVCGWLWPHARPCPRCRGALAWHPARLIDDGVVTVRVVRALDAWQRSGDRDDLEELLTVLHLDRPGSLDVAAEHGLDVEVLRRTWQRVAPDQAPHGD